MGDCYVVGLRAIIFHEHKGAEERCHVEKPKSRSVNRAFDPALSGLSKEDGQPKSRCETHQMNQWGRLSPHHLAGYKGMGLITGCWEENFGIVQDLLWDV